MQVLEVASAFARKNASIDDKNDKVSPRLSLGCSFESIARSISKHRHFSLTPCQIASHPNKSLVRCLNCNAKVAGVTMYRSAASMGKQMACIDCRCCNYVGDSRCRMIRRIDTMTGKFGQVSMTGSRTTVSDKSALLNLSPSMQSFQ